MALQLTTNDITVERRPFRPLKFWVKSLGIAVLCKFTVWNFMATSVKFDLSRLRSRIKKKWLFLHIPVKWIHFLLYKISLTIHYKFPRPSNSVLSIPDSAIAFVRIELILDFVFRVFFNDQMHLSSKFVWTPAKHSNYLDLHSKKKAHKVENSSLKICILKRACCPW